MNNLNKAFTNDQLQKLEDAAYKVAEAQAAFAEVAAEMKAESKWEWQGDIKRAANDLNELTVPGGSINWMLQAL